MAWQERPLPVLPQKQKKPLPFGPSAVWKENVALTLGWKKRSRARGRNKDPASRNSRCASSLTRVLTKKDGKRILFYGMGY